MKKLLYLFCTVLTLSAFIAIEKPSGLMVGQPAPNFTAKNQFGNTIKLNEILKSQTVVLIFYRGEWCPYCNKQLKLLEDSLSLISAKGAKVIAISPEKQENISKTLEKTKASFDIVSDENSKIMEAYKVGFILDTVTTKKYKTYGIDLAEKNGNNQNTLPVPAVYIINKDGKITYRYFDTNYKNRASVNSILKNL